MPKRLLLCAGGLLILILTAVIWYTQDSWMTNGFALRQETADWANRRSRIPDANVAAREDSRTTLSDREPGVLLRFAGDRPNVLLLRHAAWEGVYSYDLELNKTGKTSEDSWQRGAHTVTVCEDQRWGRAQALRNTNYRLFGWDERETRYETYGKYVLDSVASPGRKQAAILSAYGPKKPFFNVGLPGLGGGPDVAIHGQRYVQIMDLETKEYIDKPVKLQSELEVPCFALCWTLNERILIAYQCNLSDFQIIKPFIQPES